MINVIVPYDYDEHDLVTACLIEIFKEDEVNLLARDKQLPEDQASETIDLDDVSINTVIEQYGKDYLSRALATWKTDTDDYDYYINLGYKRLKETFKQELITSSAMKGLNILLNCREQYAVVTPFVQGLVYDVCMKTQKSIVLNTKNIKAYGVITQSGDECFYPDCVKYLLTHARGNEQYSECLLTSMDHDYPVLAERDKEHCALVCSDYKALFEDLDSAKKCMEKSWEVSNGKTNN